MPSYRVRALSLKKTKLGESDLIVSLLAEDGCHIRAVAKGARKTGSRFGARLEPFSVVDLLLNTGRTLEIVSDAEVVATHSTIRDDYDRAMAASVVTDFFDKASVECQKDERLFGLASATLDAVELAALADLPALVVAFLIKGVAMQGYRPQFAACASCGEGLAGTLDFDLELGGPVCTGCEHTSPQMMVVGAGTAAALGAMLGARMGEIATLGVPPDVVREALGVMVAYVRCHVPARLKALEMYASSAVRGPGA